MCGLPVLGRCPVLCMECSFIVAGVGVCMCMCLWVFVGMVPVRGPMCTLAALWADTGV